MRVSRCVCVAGVVAGFAAGALAQPVMDFTIDPAQSSVDLTIEIVLDGFGGDTDSSSSSVSGFVDAAADDAESISSLWLHDFFASMDSDLQYNWSLGFLSTADATLVDGTVEYANPGIVLGPEAVVGGVFEFPAVPVSVGGVMTVNYNIVFLGSGSEIIDLSTLAPSDGVFSGSVSTADGVVTMVSSIPIAGSQPLVVNASVVGEVIFSGTTTMVATAPVPSCPADMNGDGTINFVDVSAFVAAFASGDMSADFNGDGTINFVDVSAFVAAFSAGCP